MNLSFKISANFLSFANPIPANSAIADMKMFPHPRELGSNGWLSSNNCNSCINARKKSN